MNYNCSLCENNASQYHQSKYFLCALKGSESAELHTTMTPANMIQMPHHHTATNPIQMGTAPYVSC